MLHFGATITNCVAIFWWIRHHSGIGIRWCTRRIFLFPLSYDTPQIYSQMYSTYTHPSNQHGCMMYHPFKHNTRGCCFVKYSLTPSTIPPQYIVHLKISWFLPVVALISPPLTLHTLHKSFTYIFRKIYGSAWRGGGVTNPSMRGCDLHPNNTSQNEDVD